MNEHEICTCGHKIYYHLKSFMKTDLGKCRVEGCKCKKYKEIKAMRRTVYRRIKR